MRRFLHWYGAGPLHLLTMLGCFALAGYAAAELLPSNFVGIPVWLAVAVIGHDLILMPVYTLADRSAVAVFRHRPSQLPARRGALPQCLGADGGRCPTRYGSVSWREVQRYR